MLQINKFRKQSFDTKIIIVTSVRYCEKSFNFTEYFSASNQNVNVTRNSRAVMRLLAREI